MDRLSIILTLMTGAVATGSLTILAFSLGYYGWPAIIAAAVIGYLVSWPAAYLVSRRVKRLDPNWRDDRVKETGMVPKPDAPEV